MKKFNTPIKTIIAALAAMGAASAAQAGGFALLEQNASGAGVAYAGRAALGEDASAAWNNPASMSRIKKRQVVLGAHYIDLNGEFNNEGSTAATGRPAGSTAGEFGDEGYIPNFHLIVPFNEKINFGFSVATPFGLKTDYQEDWIGRFQGITSDIKSVNFNPSASYEINKQWSVGAGVSAQKLDAKLTQAVNYTPFGLPAEGLNTIAGSGWGYGFNLGVMGQVTANTRVGVAYRSAIEHDLEGTVEFTNTAGALTGVFANGTVASKIRLPASLAISSVTELSPKWQLLTDATWTEWSTVQKLTFDRVNPAAGNPALGQADALPEADYEWKNSWRFAVGGIYKYSDTINLKTGLAYDLTPVPDERRKVRLPDEDRLVLALGSQYLFNPATTFDLGIQYVMPKKARINSTENGTTVVGTSEGNAWIVSGQVAYSFLIACNSQPGQSARLMQTLMVETPVCDYPSIS